MRKDDLRQAQAEKLRDCLAEAASLIPELKQYSLEALKGNGCAAYFAVEDKTGMSKEQIEEHERLRQEWIDIDENNSEKFIVAMKSFRKQLELFNSRMVYNETWHKHIQKVNEFKIDIFTLAPVNEVEDEDIVWQKAHDESNNFINTIVELHIIPRPKMTEQEVQCRDKFWLWFLGDMRGQDYGVQRLDLPGSYGAIIPTKN